MTALWFIAMAVAAYHLVHQLKRGVREEAEDALFHAKWDQDTADWRGRREAFKVLREEERNLWNAGKSDAALDTREKADRLYPDFAKAENDTQKEMDALMRA